MREMIRVAAVVCAACLTATGFGQRLLPADLGPAEFYRPPQLTLMTGFIKDPQHQGFSLEQWAKGIGSRFDAKLLVDRAKRAGAAQIIWYDKWIDGLVFRKTKTTNFVTERDFLGELAPECKRQGVKLVIYFNTFYDGNPEFEPWAAVDQRGRPIPFSSLWPLNLLSMYSPFRDKALEQIRELLEVYDVDGIWLDVPNYPSISYDKWSQEAFQKQFGKTMLEATSAERRQFAIDSVVNWNREVAAFIRKVKPSAVVTTNRFVNPLSEGQRSAAGMAEPLDYFSTEQHTNALQQQTVPLLAELTKPVEVGSLISDDWFTPLNSGPLKTSKSANQMHLELATVLGGGVNLYLALALAHDGSAHEDTLRLLDRAGEWLKDRRTYLEGGENFADVAIVLGTVDAKQPGWPGGTAGYHDTLLRLEEHLREHGYLSRHLLNSPHSRKWDGISAGTRALVVPDRASLTPADADKVRQFVRQGGTVVAFGRGMTLGTSGESTRADGIFGVRSAGYIEPITPLGRKVGVQLERAGGPIGLQSSVIHLHPDSAEVQQWCETRPAGQMPLVTKNRVGQGAAYAVAVPESSFSSSPELLTDLWREWIGEPLWRVDDESGRYVVRLRRQKGRLIAQIMDTLSSTEGPMQRYRPVYTRLHLNAALLPFERATVVPDNRQLKVTGQGDWKSMEVYPDPELMLVLE